MNNDWINKLREEEQHFEMQAPEGLWDDIQRDLPKNADSADNSKKVVPLWLKRAMIASAACALALVCFKLAVNNDDVLDNAELAKAEKTVDNLIEEVRGGNVESIEDPLLTAQLKSSPLSAVKTNDSHLSAIATNDNTNSSQTQTGKETAVVKESAIEKESGVATEAVEKNLTAKELNNNTSPTVIPSSKSESVLLASSESANASAQIVPAAYKKSLGGISLSTQTALAMGNTPSSSYVVYNNKYMAPAINKHDKVPVGFSYNDEYKMLFSLGLLLNVPLTERLSVDCGAAMMKTEKERTIVNGALKRVISNDYDYIGIPIALKYDVIKTKNFSVYGKAGGKIDFNYAADQTAETWEDGNAEPSKMTYSIDKTKNPQFSLSAAVGAQWLLAKHLALYLEPGYVYYIDNGSSESYFKEKPHNFNVNFGVRVPINNK